MSMGRVLSVFCVLFLVAVCATATQESVLWKEKAGGNWGEPTLWSSGSLPTVGQDVNITLIENAEVVLNFSTTIRSLLVAKGRLKVSKCQLHVQAKRFCQAGTYYDYRDNNCHQCPLGQYNALTNQASCVLCPAGTYSSSTGASALSECSQCAAGTYAPQAGSSVCTPCPLGSKCPAAGLMSVQACAAGEFNAATGQTTCDACPFPDRCIGESVCKKEYIAPDCVQCAKGFFQLGTDCVPCSDIPWPAVILVVLGGVLAFLLARRGVDVKRLTQLKIFLSQMQFLSISLSFNVPWPEFVGEWATFFNVVNLNFDIASPQCYVDEWTWMFKFATVLGVGVGFLVVLEIFRRVVLLIRDRLMTREWEKLDFTLDRRLTERSNVILRMILLILTVIYVPISRLFMEVFDCVELQGQLVLRYDNKVTCTGGGWYGALVVSIVGLVFFTVGLPVAMALIIHRLLKREAAQREKGQEGVHILYDGNVVAKYGLLYESYKINNRHPYYESLYMARRVFLVLVATALISFGLVQGIVTAVVSLAFLILSFRERPFRSYSIRSKCCKKKTDAVNMIDAFGNLMNLTAGIGAVVAALVPGISLAKDAVSVIVLVVALTNVIFTVVVAALKKKKSTIADDFDEMKVMQNYKSQIEKAITEGHYDEAETLKGELNKYRGRRQAELERIKEIRIRAVDTPEHIKALTERIRSLAPPEGAEKPLPLDKAMLVGIPDKCTNELAAVQDSLRGQVDELRALRGKIRGAVQAGTLVEGNGGIAWMQELSRRCHQLREDLGVVYAYALENERYLLGKILTKVQEELQEIMRGGLSEQQGVLVARAMTVAQSPSGLSGGRSAVAPAPEADVELGSKSATGGEDGEEEIQLNVLASPSTRFTTKLDPRLWMKGATRRRTGTTFGDRADVMPVFGAFLDVVREEADALAKKMSTHVEAGAFGRAKEVLSRLEALVVSEAKVHACDLIWRRVMSMESDHEIDEGSVRMWSEFKTKVLHLLVAEQSKPMPKTAEGQQLVEYAFSPTPVPPTPTPLDDERLPSVQEACRRVGELKVQYSEFNREEKWDEAKATRDTLREFVATFRAALQEFKKYYAGRQEFDKCLAIERNEPKLEQAVKGLNL